MRLSSQAPFYAYALAFKRTLVCPSPICLGLAPDPRGITGLGQFMRKEPVGFLVSQPLPSSWPSLLPESRPGPIARRLPQEFSCSGRSQRPWRHHCATKRTQEFCVFRQTHVPSALRLLAPSSGQGGATRGEFAYCMAAGRRLTSASQRVANCSHPPMLSLVGAVALSLSLSISLFSSGGCLAQSPSASW